MYVHDIRYAVYGCIRGGGGQIAEDWVPLGGLDPVKQFSIFGIRDRPVGACDFFRSTMIP